MYREGRKNSLLQCIGKLPDEYKKNDYEMLYKELKDDITKSIESLDISILSNITDKLKYGKRKKMFYENAQKRLVDITLNEKIQYILDKMKVPVELFFCYNDKEKAIRVKEIKKDDNTLKFLDSMVFVEQSKYIKTCNVIWLNADLSKKSLIKDATNYALEILGMEEAFINVANNNPNLIKYLEKNEFESLGEEDGNIIFLKEKTEEQVKSITI